MTVHELDICGVYLIENFIRNDNRGYFIKTYTRSLALLNNLDIEVKEIYYSFSKKNVIRGMHFQRPPMDHAKLIYLTSGQITDVILDIRKSSKTYLKYIDLELSAKKNALFIPSGIAHGFLSKEDDTTVVYNQTSVYSKIHDDGILWNSFGYNWGVRDPILSDRDKSFKKLKDNISPFD